MIQAHSPSASLCSSPPEHRYECQCDPSKAPRSSRYSVESSAAYTGTPACGRCGIHMAVGIVIAEIYPDCGNSIICDSDIGHQSSQDRALLVPAPERPLG